MEQQGQGLDLRMASSRKRSFHINANPTSNSTTTSPISSPQDLTPRSQTMKQKRLQLQEALALHTRMGDPRKLTNALRDAKFLSSIPLDPISPIKIRPAEKQALQETAIINGVRTVPSSDYFGTLRILKDLSYQLCQLNMLELDPQKVYESIILRMSRTTAASDAYSRLRRVIRSSNLSLVRGDEASRSSHYHPVEVELFEADGSLQAVISSMSSFGVVRNAELTGKADINAHGFLVNMRGSSVEPWVKFDVMVLERINLSTQDSQRIARVM